MSKKFIWGFAALLATGGPVLAADAGFATGVYDWSGLWVGVHGGFVSGSLTSPISFTSTGPSGADVGVHAFYNVQTASNWVFGPYVAVPIETATGNAGSGIATKLTWALVGGGRLGYAFDRVLPYIVAGAVAGGGSVTSGGSTATATHFGYTIGGGVDLALNDSLSIGARYALVSVDQQSYAPVFSGPFGWTGNSFVATLNYRLR